MVAHVLLQTWNYNHTFNIVELVRNLCIFCSLCIMCILCSFYVLFLVILIDLDKRLLHLCYVLLYHHIFVLVWLLFIQFRWYCCNIREWWRWLSFAIEEFRLLLSWFLDEILWLVLCSWCSLVLLLDEDLNIPVLFFYWIMNADHLFATVPSDKFPSVVADVLFFK